MLDTDIEGFPETSQRKRGRFGRERYNRKNKLHEQERDIVKLWKERDMEFAIYGMENQTLPEKYMPLRILGYDGASYRSQLQKKRKRPVAVLTIVLYFGTDKVWDKPTHLKDVIYIPEGLGEYVNCSRSKFLTKLLKTFDKTFREIFPVFIGTKRREKPSAFFDNNFVNNAYFSVVTSSSSLHLASSSSKAPISSRMTCLCLWSS